MNNQKHLANSFKFTDTHCHLDFDELTVDLEALIADCAQHRVLRIIAPAISPKNWPAILNLASTHPQVRIDKALGIHPWFLNDLSTNDLDALAKLIEKNSTQLIAVGETGIDGTIAKQQNNLNKQIKFFEFQLALAKEHHKPIIVHHRQSHQGVTRSLRKYQPESAGVIHAFSGSYQDAKQYLDLGFYLGIGGTITYPRASKTIETVKKLPIDKLLLETDAPAMPLFGQQGKPNSPIKTVSVFENLCAIRAESPETIAAQLEVNVNNLFGVSNS